MVNHSHALLWVPNRHQLLLLLLLLLHQQPRRRRIPAAFVGIRWCHAPYICRRRLCIRQMVESVLSDARVPARLRALVGARPAMLVYLDCVEHLGLGVRLPLVGFDVVALARELIWLLRLLLLYENHTVVACLPVFERRGGRRSLQVDELLLGPVEDLMRSDV